MLRACNCNQLARILNWHVLRLAATAARALSSPGRETVRRREKEAPDQARPRLPSDNAPDLTSHCETRSAMVRGCGCLRKSQKHPILSVVEPRSTRKILARSLRGFATCLRDPRALAPFIELIVHRQPEGFPEPAPSDCLDSIEASRTRPSPL